MEQVALAKEVYEVSQRLKHSAKEIYRLGGDKARAERDYRLKLSQEMLILRTEGMPATMIGDLARGRVAEELFQRDATEARFKAAIEAQEALRAQLSALQSIMKYHDSI